MSITNSVIYPFRILSTQKSTFLDIGLFILFNRSIKNKLHSFSSPPWKFLCWVSSLHNHSCTGMILRNHTYLKVYKCWRILPILKTPTIKWLVIFFKRYFNFQGFYIVYIIIGLFLGSNFFTPQGFKKCKMVNLFWEKTWKNTPLG